MVNSQKFNK